MEKLKGDFNLWGMHLTLGNLLIVQSSPATREDKANHDYHPSSAVQQVGKYSVKVSCFDMVIQEFCSIIIIVIVKLPVARPGYMDEGTGRQAGTRKAFKIESTFQWRRLYCHFLHSNMLATPNENDGIQDEDALLPGYLLHCIIPTTAPAAAVRWWWSVQI